MSEAEAGRRRHAAHATAGHDQGSAAMDTINSLAAELGAQPYELAAFADLGGRTWMRYDAPLNPGDVVTIREAWAQATAEGPQFVDAVAENRGEDDVTAQLFDVVQSAGYDY